MRVLLDENLDWRLRRLLEPGYDVSTVAECGWSGKKNGDLIRVAELEFDALITLDRNLRHQQNLDAFDLAFIVLLSPSSRRTDLEPLMGSAAEVLATARVGKVYVVTP